MLNRQTQYYFVLFYSAHKREIQASVSQSDRAIISAISASHTITNISLNADSVSIFYSLDFCHYLHIQTSYLNHEPMI